jgi:hypothetical protein
MKKTFVIAWIMFAWIGGIESLSAGEDLTNLISNDAVIVASIKPGKDDPGVSYVANIWKDTLKEREKNYTKRQEAIEDIFKQPHLPNITLAIFGKDITKLYVSGGSIFELPSYLILVGVESSDKEFLRSRLDILLQKNEDLKREAVGEKEIVCNEFAGLSRDPSAYVQLDDRIAISPGIDRLKEALNISKDSIVRLSKYQDIMSKITLSGDGQLYIDNRDSLFTKVLRELENKWKITLLLAVDYVDAIGVSFDIKDKDSASARIVFKAKDPKGLEEIKNDARFLGEAISRKFSQENVEHSNEISVSGKYVILELQFKGLEGLWARVLKKE